MVWEFKYQKCVGCPEELMTDSDNILPVICTTCYNRKYGYKFEEKKVQ